MRILRAALPLALFAAAHAVSSSEAQTTRLRMTNGCDREALWIGHMAGAAEGPDPQNVKIEPGASYDMIVLDGLSGTRYWPKMRCDEKGDKCGIGESGGPGELCGIEAGCAPPVDTKFEASFGQNGVDWVDISLVDGFTLPFKFEMFTAPGKKCDAGDGNLNVTNVIDCSALSFHECPSTEDLGSQGSSVNLKVQHPDSSQIVGCYSPCSKLTLQQWGNGKANGHSPWDDSVKEYCCPTPPESPEECRAGPVKDTDFVRAVHRGCSGVYGYAYDDGMGLLLCPDDTKYKVTFYCPSGDGAGAPPEPEQAPAPAPAPAPPSPLEKKTKTPSECRHYIATTGCGWTSESSCPGQAAGKAGLARDDNSEGLACCCDLALWKGFPAEPTPLPSAPAPASQAGGEQSTRLRFTNGCLREPLWLAHEALGGIGPDKQNIKIEPMRSYDMTVYDGLAGTRYWPKMRCNEEGDACVIGNSGGAKQACGTEAGCSPPVDTKFEASFGMSGEDWIDVSLVDGWTLPFRLELRGECSGGYGNKTADAKSAVDCSGLTLDRCPGSEDLGPAGRELDLRARHPDTGRVVGCYSPCSKLTLSQWDNSHAYGRTPWDKEVKDYCCPSPPQSPKQCRAGPVSRTAFVQEIHHSCPGIYGYVYDDGMGLLRCKSDTRYEVTFYCPSVGGPEGPPAPAPTTRPAGPADSGLVSELGKVGATSHGRSYAVAGCHTLSRQECCSHKDGRPELYGDDCVVVSDVKAPARDVLLPCQPWSWVSKADGEWVGHVVGCPGDGHSLGGPPAQAETTSDAPQPDNQEFSIENKANLAGHAKSAEDKARVVLAVFDVNADEHLGYEEMNDLSQASAGGAVSIDTYDRFCAVFKEETRLGLGLKTLQEVYAKSGTLDRDFGVALGRLGSTTAAAAAAAAATTATVTTSITTTVTTTTTTLPPTLRWRVVESGGALVREERRRFSKALGTKAQGALVSGVRVDDWLELTDEPGFVLMSDAGQTFVALDGDSQSHKEATATQRRFVEHLLSVLKKDAERGGSARVSQESFLPPHTPQILVGAAAFLVAGTAMVRQRWRPASPIREASLLRGYEQLAAAARTSAPEACDV